MIRSERIRVSAIQREHGHRAFLTGQGHRQRGSQQAEFLRIVEVAGLDGGISIENRLIVLGHPARQPFSNGNLE